MELASSTILIWIPDMLHDWGFKYVECLSQWISTEKHSACVSMLNLNQTPQLCATMYQTLSWLRYNMTLQKLPLWFNQSFYLHSQSPPFTESVHKGYIFKLLPPIAVTEPLEASSLNSPNVCAPFPLYNCQAGKGNIISKV